MKGLFLLPLLLMASSALAGQPGRHYKLKKWGIRPGHYSGIAALGGGLYAVVSDKEQGQSGFHVWRLGIDSLGARLTQARDLGFRGVPHPNSRDAEGVAFCPERQTVFVSGEADQRVIEHSLEGRPTGHELAIPDKFGPGHIRPNRGFEALTWCSRTRRFWTCTESPLPTDSTLHIRLLCFGPDLQPGGEYAYTLSPPQARNAGRGHYHGVVALAPLPSGRLLVLEREARIARRFVGSRCWCRLFVYNPDTGDKVELHAWRTRLGLLAPRFSNYEGMCPGPVLADGSPTLLLLADSQARAGRALWHLRDRLMILKLPRGL